MIELAAPYRIFIPGYGIIERKIVDIKIHDLRKWTKDRHKTVDDTPYGGGPGMIFKIEPLFDCLTELTADRQKTKIVLTSPRGQQFNQSTAVQYSLQKRIIIICGHYKGVDERLKHFFDIEEISVGDYVLTGGELAALVMTDAITRLIPGAINDINSAMEDSFSENLLDCDYYTKPEKFKGSNIPDVLKSGDHKKIEEWRHKNRVEKTRELRPDLYEKYLKEIN